MKKMIKLSRFKEKENNTNEDFEYLEILNEYFQTSIGTNIEKIQNFAKYVPRQDLTNFIAKYEIFKKILEIPGSIVECGVSFGGGLMTFAQLSAILEPINYERKIIGFDTFSGFTNLSEYEKNSPSEHAHEGGFAIDSFEDLKKCTKIYDKNRFLNHVNKVEIIKGDAVKTIPKYLKENPATIVSMLHLDMVAYEPTKIALEEFLPHMAKGSLLVFNILNDNNHWPGTTKALLDTIGIKDIHLQKFNFSPYTQYAIL
jgi:hypothetical protein